jgi:hypothetical protein
MDITGMKISGVMFGDNAKKCSDALKEQAIYIVSKALIKEHNQSKGKNYSKC